MKIEIPRQITKTIYVEYGVGKYTMGGISLKDYQPEKESQGFETILLTSVDITIDLPEMDLSKVKKKIVSKLEKKKDRIKAEYHMAIKVVQDEIDNLLALEYQGE